MPGSRITFAMVNGDDRKGGLLAWQWAIYPVGHTTRANLLIHILTVPIFEIGTLTLLGSLAIAPVYALLGLAMMVGAMAAQGQGHAGEPQPPARFRGPMDVIARILAEQWIAFPRFVLTGRFARAWASASVRRDQ
jgi:hypothetical protein